MSSANNNPPAVTPAPPEAKPDAAKPEAVAVSFERIDGESPKAYAAFRAYLKLGPDRSIRKLGRKNGKCRATLENWSVKYEWTARAAAFDEHVAHIEQAALDERARKDAQKWADRLNAHRERRFRLGSLMLDTAEKLLRGKRKPDPAAADRLAKVGDSLIGLAVGAPTANLSVGASPDAEAIPVVASVGTVNVFLPEKKPLPDEAEYQAYMASKK